MSSILINMITIIIIIDPSRDSSQTSLSRTETLVKRARAEFYKTLPIRNYAFLKLHFNTNFFIFNIYIN